MATTVMLYTPKSRNSMNELDTSIALYIPQNKAILPKRCCWLMVIVGSKSGRVQTL